MKEFNLSCKEVLKIFIIILFSAFICNYVVGLYNHKSKVKVEDLAIIIEDKNNSFLFKELCKTLNSKINVKVVKDENEGISYISKGQSELFMVVNENYEESIKKGRFLKLLQYIQDIILIILICY